MTTAIRQVRLIEPDEFERMGEMKGYELVDGLRVEKGMGAKSSTIQAYLSSLLHAWARAGNHGLVFDAEGPYRCFPPAARRIRKPDVSFVRRGRLPGDVAPDGSIRIPPDFMVEVVSPNEKVYVLSQKLTDFLGVGVPLIWVVHPEIRTVRVYRPGQPTEEFGVGAVLTGDPVLPGFSVNVADLFPTT